MEYDMTIVEKEGFGPIRVLNVEGKPWFSGVDAARALGYEMPLKALRDNVYQEDCDIVHLNNYQGGTQATVVINIPGLHMLLLSTTEPAAQEVKSWIVTEVLPDIRKKFHCEYYDEYYDDSDCDCGCDCECDCDCGSDCDCNCGCNCEDETVDSLKAEIKNREFLLAQYEAEMAVFEAKLNLYRVKLDKYEDFDFDEDGDLVVVDDDQLPLF
ncbi:MAG: BRO-N domain-containing protein [Bacteroidales bacterium]